MKKILFLLLVISMVVINNDLYSQKKQRSNIQLGVKLSPGISWLKVNSQNFSSNGNNLRFSWGLVSDFQFADKYYFSTGFNVISMGGKMKYNDFLKFGNDTIGRLGEIRKEYSIKYVELPLSLKMKTRQFGDITYFGQVGLGLGMRISAYSDDDFYINASNTALSTTDNKIEDEVNFFRLSMILSAGVEYNLGGSTSLFGAITFNNGFSNVFDFKNNIPPYQAADAINNSLELTIGMIF